MTYLVKNKRTGQEQYWEQEDIDNAKKAKLFDRFIIVKEIAPVEKTPPMSDVMEFLNKHANKETVAEVKTPEATETKTVEVKQERKQKQRNNGK